MERRSRKRTKLEKVERKTSSRKGRSPSPDFDIMPPTPKVSTPNGKGKQLLKVGLFGRKRKAPEPISDSDSDIVNPFTDSDSLYSPKITAESSSESEVDQFAPTQGPSTSRNNKRQKHDTKERRIRKAQKCDYCGKFVVNIWRHRKDIHQILSVPNKSLLRGNKGYIVKICPYKKCDAVVDRLTDHHIRKHKVPKKSLQLKRLQQKAVPVQNTSLDRHRRKRIKTESNEEKQKLRVKNEKIDEQIIISSDEAEVSVKKEKIDIITITSSDEESMACAEDQIDQVKEQVRIQKIKTEESDSEDETDSDNETDSDSETDSEIETDSENSLESDKNEKEEFFFQNREVSEFVKTLQKFDLKSRKDALQHACQAWRIWGYISKERKLTKLLNIDKLNDWLAKFLTDKAPGTARSYLGSLALFVGHLIRHAQWRKGVSKALRFKDIKLLSKQIKKKVQTRRTRIEVQEIETMLTPADFTEFMGSDIAREAEEKLKGPIPNQVVPADLFKVRNYLLLRLLQTNPQRPGAIKNLTKQSIDRAHVTDKGAVVMETNKILSRY